MLTASAYEQTYAPPGADNFQADLILRSRIAGRERWLVSALYGQPIWALAVASYLRAKDFIRVVVANPLTGRILIEYRPTFAHNTMETTLQEALARNSLSQTKSSTETIANFEERFRTFAGAGWRRIRLPAV